MIAIATDDAIDHDGPATAPPRWLPVRGDGAEPEVVRPTDLGEAGEALAGRGRVLARGRGTKLDWGAPAEGVERVVDTRGLDRVVRHDPADLTATVQAGAPLAELQAELGRSGQWLALDPPLHDHTGRPATVGGVIAAADHGPRRLAHGAPRDQVIGATFVLADGTVARTGGNVIKNVAGYDLAKLLCGSLGTLALIVDVTVRLQPLPEASATVGVHTTPAQAHRVWLAVSNARLEPAAADHLVDLGSGDQAGWLWLRFDGSEAVVAEKARAAAALATDQGLTTTTPDDPDRLWDGTLSRSLAGGADETVVGVSAVPSVGSRVAATAARAAAEAGLEGRCHSHVALGLHRVGVSGGDAADHAAVARALRADGHRAEVRRRVAGVDDHVDAWTDGELPSAWPLMRSVKQRLDPDRRLAPGRFLGGL